MKTSSRPSTQSSPSLVSLIDPLEVLREGLKRAEKYAENPALKYAHSYAYGCLTVTIQHAINLLESPRFDKPRRMESA